MIVSENIGIDSGGPLFDSENFKYPGVLVTLRSFDHPTAGLRFELLEINDPELILDIPSQFCTEGHHLMFELRIDGRAAEFTSTAKVLSLESEKAGRARAKIILLQYDKKSWHDILRHFSSKQAEVSRRLAAIKGY